MAVRGTPPDLTKFFTELAVCMANGYPRDGHSMLKVTSIVRACDSLSLVTPAVASLSNLDILCNFICESLLTGTPFKIVLPLLTSFIKILDVPYFDPKELKITQEALKKALCTLVHAEVFAYLSTKPWINCNLVHSTLCTIYCNLWDSQQGTHAKKALGQPIFLAGWSCTIRPTARHTRVLLCQRCWKWGHPTIACYMIARGPYNQYVLSHANNEDISTCMGFQALTQANTKLSKGLRFTGWFVNLAKRMEGHWPSKIHILASAKLIPTIPKLHKPMHKAAHHQVFLLNLIHSMGKSDLEMPEQVWSAHNALRNSTKTQGSGAQSDNINNHIAVWNWMKYISIRLYLACKFCNCLAEHNIQREGHHGFLQIVALTEPQVHKTLAEEEGHCLAAGGILLHATSAVSFVTLALEIEDIHMRHHFPSHGLTGGWAHQAVKPALCSDSGLGPVGHVNNAENAEDIQLWLPSQVEGSARTQVCCSGRLTDIEERLQNSRMVAFKNKNIHGQRDGTRSRSVINRVHKHAQAAAEKYQAAHLAKMALLGPCKWEMELQELLDADKTNVSVSQPTTFVNPTNPMTSPSSMNPEHIAMAWARPGGCSCGSGQGVLQLTSPPK
ncbi:unnamed protein product [Cyclocybe aegerita]|uniref:Uncharacterized protein n=1 Tax=Cyclocybe aegerita TaxID=1973307 RepID=A0A8S0WD80_CYCAE|nr:unnamed protein product [Cyclocybe aegerita]